MPLTFADSLLSMDWQVFAGDATIAGENSALENLTQKVADQIVTRLSIYARGE